MHVDLRGQPQLKGVYIISPWRSCLGKHRTRLGITETQILELVLSFTHHETGQIMSSEPLVPYVYGLFISSQPTSDIDMKTL